MQPKQLSVGFIPLPDFTLTPFSALIDMLRLAADDGDGSRPRRARWRILGNAPVRSSSGVFVTPDEVYGDPTR
ncbi:MAG: GlxA family transcriptional regulator, partial [Sphingorhabdus sp.]